MPESQETLPLEQAFAAIQTALDQYKGLLKLIIGRLDQIEAILTPAEVDPDQIPLNQLLEEMVRQMGDHGRLLQLIPQKPGRWRRASRHERKGLTMLNFRKLPA